MRWCEDSERRREAASYRDPVRVDCLCAREIIYDAYREGYITRKVRDIAFARIDKVINGDWMLEHPVVSVTRTIVGVLNAGGRSYIFL